MKGLFTSLLLVLLGVSGLMSPTVVAGDEIPCDPYKIAKLLASDGAEGDFFGYPVAISGTIALVGTSGDDDNGSLSGSAYIFEQQQDGSWLETAKLLASDGASDDLFGRSVAISGTTALIGAYRDDDDRNNSGSAYIFEQQQDGSWLETAKLRASDGASSDQFSRSVAISGTTALIGAYGDDDSGSTSGSAYIFEQQQDGSWLETAKLRASDGASDDYFGRSVAISGTTALIGAYGDDDNGSTSGSAYIFEQQQDGSWLETAKLLASDGASDDYFGLSVAISGTTALVGTSGDDDNGSLSGSAYIFEQQQDGSWLETAKLLASDGTLYESFGYSVAISGTTALVGAYSDDDNGSDSGSAYIFERQQDGSWPESAKLLASDGTLYDRFGYSVAISGTIVLVGSYGDDDNGSAYMFQISDGLGEVDCNGNGLCDVNDLALGTSQDCDGNGILDECDIADGLYDDVDLDGIPDTCEQDCDGDLVPDDYEIEQGTELDCNANAIPDTCDITNGTSPDGDSDGIPDECDPSYVITVAADGSGLFNQIQPAIDLSLPGATIQVASGTYDSSLVFPDHAIRLVSESGPGSTIITGTNYQSVVYIGEGHGRSTSLEGFTLSSGFTSLGGGLKILQSSPTILKCVLLDNLAQQGGGVLVVEGAPIFDECRFLSNTALRGGGINIQGIHSSGDPVQLIGSLVQDNFVTAPSTTEGSGGGLACTDALVEMIGSTLHANESLFTGGGLVANNSTVQVELCQFLSNVATLPGGAATSLSSSLSMVSSTFCGNQPGNILGVWNDLGGNLFDDSIEGCVVDCNANGFPDFIDIAFDTSLDENGNGVPDECDCLDTNGDSLVDVTDVLNVIDSWGDCVPDADCPADVDDDGLVNVNDILLVISSWGDCS